MQYWSRAVSIWWSYCSVYEYKKIFLDGVSRLWMCFITDSIFKSVLELYYDRGNHHEFTSLVKELARPGEITGSTTFAFEFQQVEKPYESYTGANVRLRWVICCSLLSVLICVCWYCLWGSFSKEHWFIFKELMLCTCILSLR